MRHFGDEDTNFEIVRSRTPVDVDGFKLNEPTGEIRCDECGGVAKNIDEIPHDNDCPQRFTHSWWYLDTAASGD